MPHRWCILNQIPCLMSRQMNQMLSLKQCCNNFWMKSGVHYRTLSESNHLQNSNTVHLTANSWLCILRFVTFNTFWKLASSMYSQITTTYSILIICNQNQISTPPSTSPGLHLTIHLWYQTRGWRRKPSSSLVPWYQCRAARVTSTHCA